MNAKRRKQIEEIKSRLEDLKADEDEAFNNLPESIQDGERGDTMQNNSSHIDDAISALEEIE